jgi:hypothetical protein
VFPSKKHFFHEISPNLVEKMKQVCVLPKLIDCIFALWMSKGAHDIFALVIKNLGCDWQPKQVTIGLFNTT